jgi:hypothetical protein
MIMDNFQDHGKLLCLPIHLPLFLSIEVRGDEYAGSKLEVPCLVRFSVHGAFGVRGHTLPQRTMVPTIARWKMRVGASWVFLGSCFDSATTILGYMYLVPDSHTLPVLSSPSSGDSTNLTRPRVITHHLEVNFWRRETWSGHQKNERRWDSHTSSLGHGALASSLLPYHDTRTLHLLF